MNRRIYELRKALKLSQDAFGKRISISGAALSRIENGVNNPSEQTVSLICREFGANEEWLKTGKGAIFMQSDSNLIAQLVQQYHFKPIEQKMLEAYITLPAQYREGVLRYAESLVASILGEKSIDAQVEEYRQELLDEKKGITSSVSDGGKENIS